MSETKEFWEGDFGDSYHQRCRVDWRARIKFWGQILEITGARSVYEWGCGPGWNLSAIQACSNPPATYGTECNGTAIQQAQLAGLMVDQFPPDNEDSYELVCTVGALIHVDPTSVHDVMRMLVDASSDYVLAVEYHSKDTREIEYRGHQGKLWAMDYGKVYQSMGLKMVTTGEAGDGFDDCHFWLLRK